MVKAFNFDNNLCLKIGHETPYNDVNLAYFKTPEINPDNNLQLFNNLVNSSIFSNNFADKQYVAIADEKHYLHNIDNYAEDTFFMNDFCLSDIKDSRGNILYYSANLRYLHEDYPDADFKKSITIEDIHGNIITQKELSYIIQGFPVGTSSNGLTLYNIYIFFNNSPENHTLFTRYNPYKLNIKDYRESLLIDSAYKPTSMEDIFAHKNDLSYKRYAKQNAQNRYNILVPIKAEKTKKDYHDTSYTYYPPVPFRYEIYKQGYIQSESKGLAVSFVVDRSGSMSGDKHTTTEQAVNDFIANFSNPDDNVNAKFNIIYFNDKVRGASPGYYFADESNPPVCSFEPGGGTNISSGFQKSIEVFRNHSKSLEGYKKIIILLTDGKDSLLSKIRRTRLGTQNKQAHQAGVHEVYVIGVGRGINSDDLRRLADPGRYKHASNAADILKVYNDIAKEAAPKLVDKLDKVEDRIASGNQKIYIPIDKTPPTGLTESEIKYKIIDPSGYIQSRLVRIKEDGIVEHLTGKITTKTSGDLYLEVFSTKEGSMYTKKYYLKSNNDFSKIYASIDPDLTRNDNWYLDIKNGTFTIKKDKFALQYGIPEFNNQEFSEIYSSPYKTIEEISPIINSSIKLSNAPLYVDETTEKTIDNHVIKSPANIEVTTEDGKKLTVVDWDITTGVLTIYEDHKDAVTVKYTYKEEWYQYNGYYDENGNFIHLDLNPAFGHFYTDNNPYTTGDLVVKPTIDLYNKPIYIYIRPQLKVPTNEKVNGFYNDRTLFHTIGEQLKPSHPFIKKDIENGFYKFDDIKLVCIIYIKPHLDIEELTLEDTRTRGGGIREEYEAEEKVLWDIANWDGEPYPINGVVVIELPRSVLNTFTKKEVLEKINKHIGFGVFPVIRYV